MFNINYTNNEVSLEADKFNENQIAKNIRIIKQCIPQYSFVALNDNRKAEQAIAEKASRYACGTVTLLSENYGFSDKDFFRDNMLGDRDYMYNGRNVNVNMPSGIKDMEEEVKATPAIWIKYLHALRLTLNAHTEESSFARTHQG